MMREQEDRKILNQEPFPWEVLYEPPPARPPHSCTMPGTRHCSRPGTIIKCRTCGQQWIYQKKRWQVNPTWHKYRLGDDKACFA